MAVNGGLSQTFGLDDKEAERKLWDESISFSALCHSRESVSVLQLAVADARLESDWPRDTRQIVQNSLMFVLINQLVQSFCMMKVWGMVTLRQDVVLGTHTN